MFMDVNEYFKSNFLWWTILNLSSLQRLLNAKEFFIVPNDGIDKHMTDENYVTDKLSSRSSRKTVCITQNHISCHPPHI